MRLSDGVGIFLRDCDPFCSTLPIMQGRGVNGVTARAAPSVSSWKSSRLTGLWTEPYGKARSGDGEGDAEPASEGEARMSTKGTYIRH